MKKNMDKNYTIEPLTIESLTDILSWEKSKNQLLEKYIQQEKEDLAKEYIVGDNFGLLNLIDLYYFDEVRTADSENEKISAVVLKNKENQNLAFAVFSFRELDGHFNNAYIDMIITNPNHQNKGYATILLNEIFTRKVKFFGWEPDDFRAYIHKDNTQAIHLFNRFDFKFSQGDPFLYANNEEPTRYQPKQHGSNE